MEAKQTELLKISTCNGVMCHKCSKEINNCDDCTEDAKIRMGLSTEPDRNKCCHLTPHFCSVKKFEIERERARKRYEFTKNFGCPYCKTKGKFKGNYNNLICKICNYRFDPKNRQQGTLPKEIVESGDKIVRL